MTIVLFFIVIINYFFICFVYTRFIQSALLEATSKSEDTFACFEIIV